MAQTEVVLSNTERVMFFNDVLLETKVPITGDNKDVVRTKLGPIVDANGENLVMEITARVSGRSLRNTGSISFTFNYSGKEFSIVYEYFFSSYHNDSFGIGEVLEATGVKNVGPWGDTKEILIEYLGARFVHIITLNDDQGIVFLQSTTVTLQVSTNAKGTEGANALMSARGGIDSRIAIFSVTDQIRGANASQTIYRITYDQGRTWDEWENSLKHITQYVVPTKLCTFTSKVWANRIDIRALMLYSGLRVFLWFLVKGVWDFSILVRSRSKEFFHALASSKYRIYIEAFESERLRGYGKYFVKC